MHKNLIILAGGASSRMKKAAAGDNVSDEEKAQANGRSKGLISVDKSGRPIMDYVLYNAKRAGYENIYIVINEQGGMFKEFYGSKTKDNEFKGLKISFAIQYLKEGREKPFGTADALTQAVDQFPELNTQAYTVCNSDNLYSVDAFFALRKSTAPNAFISYSRDALKFKSERIARFALAKLNKDNFLVDIIEKPKPEDVDKYRDAEGKLRVSMNIFKFDGAMLSSYIQNCPVDPVRNEKELPTALMNMLKENENAMEGVPLAEHVPDLTAKDDIAVVKEYLKEHYSVLDWEAAVLN